MCRCVGIGRRDGLKIRCWQQRVGSTPTTGTTGESGSSVPLDPIRTWVWRLIVPCSAARKFFGNEMTRCTHKSRA